VFWAVVPCPLPHAPRRLGMLRRKNHHGLPSGRQSVSSQCIKRTRCCPLPSGNVVQHVKTGGCPPSCCVSGRCACHAKKPPNLRQIIGEKKRREHPKKKPPPFAVSDLSKTQKTEGEDICGEGPTFRYRFSSSFFLEKSGKPVPLHVGLCNVRTWEEARRRSLLLKSVCPKSNPLALAGRLHLRSSNLESGLPIAPQPPHCHVCRVVGLCR